MTDTTLAERRSSLQGILKPPPFCNDSTTASSARCGFMAAAPLSVDFEIGRPLTWISQTYRCIGAENLRKMLCCNSFFEVQESPDADRVYAEAV
jgi:hypothetical protein